MTGKRNRSGGRRPGPGRKPGTKNQSTLEREELSRRLAVRQDPHLRGKPLAKEVIENFMHIAAGYAAQYQPRAGKDRASQAAFEKWARLAVSWACELAPYQSPTYGAITIAPAQEPGDGAVVLHSMEEVRREMLIAGIKPEMLARALDEGDDGEPLEGEVLEVVKG